MIQETSGSTVCELLGMTEDRQRGRKAALQAEGQHRQRHEDRCGVATEPEAPAALQKVKAGHVGSKDREGLRPHRLGGAEVLNQDKRLREDSLCAAGRK